VVIHGRYVAFQMAEIAIPKALFAGILRMIGELRPPRDSVRLSHVLRSLKLTENIRLDDGKFGTF
jgi:hypothetical protein